MEHSLLETEFGGPSLSEFAIDLIVLGAVGCHLIRWSRWLWLATMPFALNSGAIADAIYQAIPGVTGHPMLQIVWLAAIVCPALITPNPARRQTVRLFHQESWGNARRSHGPTSGRRSTSRNHPAARSGSRRGGEE